ncbi:MAG: restriction endonuclease subunit S [Dehalococcoidia bacterium]|nr:restriction endonuclease subunit S [Dehalococcoidia bacterium]
MIAKPLPPGWRWARLGEVTTGPDTVDPRRLGDGTFQYIDISSIDSIRKIITEPTQIPNGSAPSRARQVVRSGDVLVSGTRPNLNAVALVPRQLDGAICTTGFSVLRPSSGIDSEWLFAFARTQTFIEAVSDMVVGLLYPAVTDRQLRSIPIPLPPLPEQRRIAAVLRDQLDAVRRARDAAETQRAVIDALPQSLLRQAFAGEL